MRYYKRNWDEIRGDKFSNWGKSIWYFETDNFGQPLKQIEVYDNGKVLKYDQTNLEDEYGSLGDQQLDLDEFLSFQITKQDFYKVWSKTDKPYKILKYPPAYMDGYVSISGCLSEYCIPFEFINSKGEKWVYGFEGEIEKTIKIITLKENRYYLVSTKNEFNIVYLIDIEKTEPIDRFENVLEILENKKQIILIHSTNSITIINNPNEIEYFESLCFDGIKENRIEDNILKGVLYDFKDKNEYYKTKYQINLKTLHFSKDELNENRMKENKKKEHIKWWEIWK